MARHKLKRNICAIPKEAVISTDIEGRQLDPLTIEEYETIRLIDYIGCTQSEAAEYMNVARTTVQAIYFSARKKLAKLVVECGSMKIEGGDYALCKGDCNLPQCGDCSKTAE